MKVIFLFAFGLMLTAQDGQRGHSLDEVLMNRLRNPNWGMALKRLEAKAAQAEALASKLRLGAIEAQRKRDELVAKAADDPSKKAEAEDAAVKSKEAEAQATAAEKRAQDQRAKVGEAQQAVKALGDAQSQSQVKDGKAATGPVQEATAKVATLLAVSDGALPNRYLIPGLQSAGVTINTYFGTRWSNLYRDPQARDTYFRPKGFFALEHEQYFWLADHPMLLTKWGGGAMIQGAKESDYQAVQTADGFRKAVNATDAASAHAYVWVGGFLTETTSVGLFLQHQFSNYSFQPSDDPAAPKAFGFTDVIRSQRRLGFLLQQHDALWRGSLLEYSRCSDPLFADARNRQFLRGRAMYTFEAAPSTGFYLEGSINRGRRSDRDRDDATITLGFRVDLRVWAGS